VRHSHSAAAELSAKEHRKNGVAFVAIKFSCYDRRGRHIEAHAF